MNFRGKEAISRSTRTTGRNLLLLSLMLGLAGLGWIDIADNSLLGLKVKEDKFLPLLKIVCSIAAVALAAQWYGDFQSYRGWNVTGKLSGVSRIGASNKTKFEDLMEDSAKLSETLSRGSKMPGVKKLKEDLDRIEAQLGELHWNIKRFDLFTRFYVFGRHLTLPFSAAFIAFFLERHA